MKIATGHINASELVPNRDRRFGQGTHFNHVTLLQAGQKPRSLLFSNDQMQVARERAEANPEDCLEFEPEQVRVDRAVAIARRDVQVRVVDPLVIAFAAARRSERLWWFAAGCVAGFVAQVLGLYLAGQL